MVIGLDLRIDSVTSVVLCAHLIVPRPGCSHIRSDEPVVIRIKGQAASASLFDTIFHIVAHILILVARSHLRIGFAVERSIEQSR